MFDMTTSSRVRIGSLRLRPQVNGYDCRIVSSQFPAYISASDGEKLDFGHNDMQAIRSLNVILDPFGEGGLILDGKVTIF